MSWWPAADDLAAPRPWLAPYAAQGLPLVRTASMADGRQGAAEVLNAGLSVAGPGFDALVRPALATGPLRFVPAQEAPADEAYESFIHRTARVPTRDSLHDFFNGLVWLHLPRSKRKLNELQAAEIERRGAGATRGPLRDALTLFDENGAVLDAPAPLWNALLARDWHALFITGRPAWRDARVLVFGHALLEKLCAPRKALTAHVLRAPRGLSIAIDDEALAQAIDAEHLAAKPFVPLPVLGIPGWWAANEQAGFYEDAAVFRPARQGVGRGGSR